MSKPAHGQRIEIEANGNEPRLLLFADKPVMPCALVRLKEVVGRWANGDGQALVIEPGITVYQCVDGQWKPVHSKESGPLRRSGVKATSTVRQSHDTEFLGSDRLRPFGWETEPPDDAIYTIDDQGRMTRKQHGQERSS